MTRYKTIHDRTEQNIVVGCIHVSNAYYIELEYELPAEIQNEGIKTTMAARILISDETLASCTEKNCQ